MKLTFVDSGVLIAAAQGTDKISEQAIAILTDPARLFVSSDVVWLEVLPKAIFHRRSGEVEFYRAFFASVSKWVAVSPELIQRAKDYGCQSGRLSPSEVAALTNTL